MRELPMTPRYNPELTAGPFPLSPLFSARGAVPPESVRVISGLDALAGCSLMVCGEWEKRHPQRERETQAGVFRRP